MPIFVIILLEAWWTLACSCSVKSVTGPDAATVKWGKISNFYLSWCLIQELFINLIKWWPQVSACTDDIKTWMTKNQLKLNNNKTEALLFPFSSSLKQSTISLPDSITFGSHSNPFSDSARNLGFILNSNLSMKKHVSHKTLSSCLFKAQTH